MIMMFSFGERTEEQIELEIERNGRVVEKEISNTMASFKNFNKLYL